MNSPTLPRLSYHEWACIRTELLWAYDSLIPRDALRKAAQAETGHRAIHVRRGSLRWITPQRSFTVTEGQWFIIPQDSWTQEFSADAEVVSLYFACEWPSGSSLLTHQGLVFSESEYPELLKLATDLASAVARVYPMEDRRELSRQASAFGDFLHQQSLFLQWLHAWFQVMVEKGAQISAMKCTGDERPLRAASILNQAPLDKGFPQESLLRGIGLSEVQINRLFQQEFGLTMRKYWDGRRLQMARTLLETTSLPVKEVSFRLGFLSDSHFVTWFRRQSGKSPNASRSLA